MTDQPPLNGVGSRIRAAREDAKLTQLELALMIGVRERTVVRWEQGHNAPRTEMVLWRIAKATRKPLEFFDIQATA
jgi:transcriptional regulator with XRE-family HTH domain